MTAWSRVRFAAVCWRSGMLRSGVILGALAAAMIHLSGLAAPAGAVGVVPCDPAPAQVASVTEYGTCHQARLDFSDPNDEGEDARVNTHLAHVFAYGFMAYGGNPSGTSYSYQLFQPIAPNDGTTDGQTFRHGTNLTVDNAEFTLRAGNGARLNPHRNGWGVFRENRELLTLQNGELIELSFAFRNEGGYAAVVSDDGGIVNPDVNGPGNARSNTVLGDGMEGGFPDGATVPAPENADTAGGPVLVNRWQWLTLTAVQLYAEGSLATARIIGFDDDGNETGSVDLAATRRGTASHTVGLVGSRFHVVGTLHSPNANRGFRLRSVIFQYRQAGQVVPLPGALIPVLTGLAALGGIALRRRVKRSAGSAQNLA